MEDEFDLNLLPSRRFQPLVYGVGAWTDNLPFAYDLVAALKPCLVVELGTDRGESYFAFCQSVAENGLATHCCAIDTWRGDHQAGDYDETTFAEVSAHNQAHYRNFSRLVRSTFDEALSQFADESIDLLHLDGLHTETAVRHDVESWLPKISPGGILLLHDVSVRTRDFGVWKIWEELRQRGRSFAFVDGPGLGVWQKPPAKKLPEPLETLLNGASKSADRLTYYYREQARALHEKIVQQWRDGTIRTTAAAHQTIIQVFHSHDGIHREEDSLVARIGHETWRDISLRLPAGAGAAPLRIDFLSTFTVIDIASIELIAGSAPVFTATEPDAFECVRVEGDAVRCEHSHYLRLKVTGPDPQTYLPPLPRDATQSDLQLDLRLRVCSGEPPD